MNKVPPPPLDGLADLVARVEHAVFYVRVRGGTGSAFAIPVRSDDPTAGVLVTNAHVVEDEEREVGIHTPGEEDQRARVRLIDPSTDIALLQLPTLAAAVLPCRDIDVRVGEAVIAIGSPLDYEASVSFGIVSALGRRGNGTDGVPFDGVIQTDAAINYGNSGGPLIDVWGCAIGINYSGYDDAQNISFAIPIGCALDAYAENCETGASRLRRGWLGVRTGTLPLGPNGVERLGQRSGAGLVVPPRRDSPAEAAGLRADDIIVRFDDEDVTGSIRLFRLLNRHRIGKPITVEFVRNGKVRKATVTPTEREY